MTQDVFDLPIHVTLVHGTWARGIPALAARLWPSKPASWCAEGSTFRTRLSAQLNDAGIPFELSVLNWSGANSIFERDRAATKLAEALIARAHSGTCSSQLIIAHSHGGNVVIQALGKAEQARIPLPAVATIATPFLHVEEGSRWRSRALSQLLAAIFLSVVLYAAVMVLIAPNVGEALLLRYFVYVIFPIAAVVSFKIATYLTSGRREWARRLAAAASYRLNDRKSHLLVIRGMEDEAGMALSLGLVGIRLADVISMVANRMLIGTTVLGVVALIMFVGLSVLLWIVETTFSITQLTWPNEVLSLIGAASPRYYKLAVIIGAISVAILIVPGLFKLAFGRELLLGSVTLAVTANSVPDVSSRITVTTLSRGQQREAALLHSLYDHVECVPTIVAWLERIRAVTDCWR